MAVDIVIPLGRSARWDHTDLRYCLRSLTKHLRNYGNLYIIGDPPDWLTGAFSLKMQDHISPHFKERNIYQKIKAAAESDIISDPFLMVNDDHYLLETIDAFDFPVHHSGPMQDQWEQRSQSLKKDEYCNTLKNTLELHPGCDNYDVHSPMLFRKWNFKYVAKANWNVFWGYGLKTLYCMENGIAGTYYPDLKINTSMKVNEIKEAIDGRPYFSIGDKGNNTAMSKVMEELYRHKSRWER